MHCIYKNLVGHHTREMLDPFFFFKLRLLKCDVSNMGQVKMKAGDKV